MVIIYNIGIWKIRIDMGGFNMYTMELKTNLLLITMSGFITQEEGISYIDELKKNIKNICPTEYNIVIDSRKLKNSTEESRASREQVMSIINITPFKKCYSIMPKDIIATIQGSEVGILNDGFNDTIFAESYAQLLKSIA